jgi:hypothetical protein
MGNCPVGGLAKLRKSVTPQFDGLRKIGNSLPSLGLIKLITPHPVLLGLRKSVTPQLDGVRKIGNSLPSLGLRKLVTPHSFLLGLRKLVTPRPVLGEENR